MKRETQPWDKNLQLLLVLIVGFNLLPHLGGVPIWISALSFLFLGAKTLSLIRAQSLPPRWLLWILSIVGAAGVLFHFGTIFGPEAASALLVFLASLKLLETDQYRDAMFVILTSYFLLMCHLLNSQSLLSTVYMATDIMLITTLMFQLHKRDRRRSARSFRPIMRMLAYTVPVWVFLFIVFPRFSTGLWRLQETSQPSAGFSEDLNPGSIDSLVESDEPAFRVTFTGSKRPSPEGLYWRGTTLTVSDGLQWRPAGRPLPLETLADAADVAGFPSKRAPAPDSNFNYQIWLEPNFNKWLFILDYPSRAFLRAGQAPRGGVKRSVGLTLEAPRRIQSRITYPAASTALAPTQVLSTREKEAYLQHPDDLGERTERLIELFAKRAQASPNYALAPEEALSEVVLSWLMDEGFRYSKSPGVLRSSNGVQQMTEFLFTRKVGFCEHYAGTYATLMRALGVPARVTVGFQGGQYNRVGDYLLVRNLDAHAWAEIWKSDPGSRERGSWHRVDPTATIAPLRIQLGGEFNRLDPDLFAGLLSPEEIRQSLDRRFSRVSASIAMTWDAMQMRWNSFLLNYDLSYQRTLFERLGLPGGGTLRFLFIALLIAVVGVTFLMMTLHWTLRAKTRVEDPRSVLWNHFCAKLAKRGLVRRSSEGPVDFSRRAARELPDRADEIQRIAARYIELQYGVQSGLTDSPLFSKSLKEFRQSVRRFSIRSNS